jgi:heptosyltransferase-2
MLSASIRRKSRDFFHACLFAPPCVALAGRLLGFAAGIFGPRAAATTSHPERLLVVKLDRIGDFVMVTPFLRELRRNFPEAWITLVVTELVLPLARTCPHVNEVFALSRPGLGLAGIWRQWRERAALAWRQLLPLRPTLAILPRWDVDLYEAYALLALSGAARRVGYATAVSSVKARQNRGADRLLHLAVTESAGRHEVEKNLDLLRALGLRVESDREELWPGPGGEALVTRLLPGRERHFLVALCPLSAEAVKDWPLARFLEVVRRFSDRPGVTFLLLVGPEYAALATDPAVQALPNLVPLAGRLSLDETAQLLQRCGLVLTVDTGLMHIASALERPLVLVSGLAENQDASNHYSPDRFGPWRADCTLVAPLVPASGPRRIDAVTVEQVVAAVAARLPAP